jgi:phosphatidylinositol alpha-1,6-mannosyltransferase
MDRKKILIVTSTFPKDTQDRVTARFVYDLATALTGVYEVFVLAPHAAGLSRCEESNGLHVERFRYFFPATWQALSSGEGLACDVKKNIFSILQVPLYLIAQVRSVRRLVKKNDITTVNAHWLVPSGLSCALANVRNSFTCCVTVHAADIFALKRAKVLGSWILRFILKKTKLILPVSTYIKKTIDEVHGSEVTHYEIIPMGANLNFTPTASHTTDQDPGPRVSDVRLLFVGKLVEKKGVEHLLRALRILKRQHVRASLQIIGGGPLERSLKTLATTLQVNDRVDFYGWVNNEVLPKFFGSNDILVVPSVFDRKGETEGMPVVIAESLSCGVPVLASRISGISDIIKEDYNGWFVEPADEAALAAKIKKISKLSLREYKANALASARGLDYKSIASRYKEAIERLVV